MTRRWVATIALAAAVLDGGLALRAAEARSVVGPYFSAPFEAKKLPYPFAQDPSWARSGEVLSAELDAAGIKQVYRARADGSHQSCLTCNTVQGPNGFPQERPQADWILFASYGQQPVHVGGPGLGGYGGDLYVMRPDGTHPYRLTTNSDPDDGAVYTTNSGVPYDNFHAFWSPSGAQIAWTHCEAHPLSDGGQTWQILVGDFVVEHGVPSLRNVRVVGPPYGAYETQPWSPDGNGFLFSATGGLNSPFQATPPGWGNMRVYYMRLSGDGASPSNPQVTLIGDNTPVYQEQAIFTPDMRTVLLMSNRGSTVGSWYGVIAAAAQRTGFDAPDTGSTQTLQFLADFDGPDFHSDLYAVDVDTGAYRRLTQLDRVIPEFFWNHDYTKIIWGIGGSVDAYAASFPGIVPAQRKIPERTPPSLHGTPIDMSRVAAQAQPIRDPGPTDNAPLAVPPPTNPAAPFPHASQTSDHASVPGVTATYVPRWLDDLEALGEAAATTFTLDPPKRLGLGH
jgi:hypothetical protein